MTMAMTTKFTAAEVTQILTRYLLENKPSPGNKPNERNWSKFDDRVWTVAGAAPITFTVTSTTKPRSKS